MAYVSEHRPDLPAQERLQAALDKFYAHERGEPTFCLTDTQTAKDLGERPHGLQVRPRGFIAFGLVYVGYDEPVAPARKRR